MNTAHHAVLDTAADRTADCIFELGAAIGVLHLARTDDSLEACQNAIVCADAVLATAIERLGNTEMSLRNLTREMRGEA